MSENHVQCLWEGEMMCMVRGRPLWPLWAPAPPPPSFYVQTRLSFASPFLAGCSMWATVSRPACCYQMHWTEATVTPSYCCCLNTTSSLQTFLGQVSPETLMWRTENLHSTIQFSLKGQVWLTLPDSPLPLFVWIPLKRLPNSSSRVPLALLLAAWEVVADGEYAAPTKARLVLETTFFSFSKALYVWINFTVPHWTCHYWSLHTKEPLFRIHRCCSNRMELESETYSLMLTTGGQAH